MRHGRRDAESADLVHELNQRYRQEFDRAERLQAELADIHSSRLWPWFCRLRRQPATASQAAPSGRAAPVRKRFSRMTTWVKSLFRREDTNSVSITPAWYELFEPHPTEQLSPRQVSVIIPFRDQLDLLTACLRSLRKTASDVELILVDNGSSDPRTRVFLKDWETLGLGKLVRQNEPFNFARLCNAGATAASRDVLLFLNNDITADKPGWLESMLTLAADPRVGIVGATLFYPNQTIQHVGLAPTGPDGAWEHPYRYADASHPGDQGELSQIRSLSAVTGACLMIRRELFQALDGFDERLAVTMNDVDLCRRARDSGHEVVISPHAHLVHFESLSRGYQPEAA